MIIRTKAIPAALCVLLAASVATLAAEDRTGESLRSQIESQLKAKESLYAMVLRHGSAYAEALDLDQEHVDHLASTHERKAAFLTMETSAGPVELVADNLCHPAGWMDIIMARGGAGTGMKETGSGTTLAFAVDETTHRLIIERIESGEPTP